MTEKQAEKIANSIGAFVIDFCFFLAFVLTVVFLAG